MTLEELEQRIKKIEEVIKQLSSKSAEYHINIENVEKLVVKDPILEHLTFELDNIDIKELSGSMNLGNNFGIKTKIHKKHKGNEFDMEKVDNDGVYKEPSRERKSKRTRKNENTRKNKTEQKDEQANPENEDNVTHKDSL